MHIGLVANEVSADRLGAALMQALRARQPGVRFSGVGGPAMAAQGLKSLVPLERLAVMGLVEVVRHLPGLLRIRADLAQHFLTDPPDVFVGIDAPDFNLGLARRLKARAIPCVHYVSPTVWAWRPGRVKTLRKSVDMVLAIFPFEVDFLHAHQVPAIYVGHPLADALPLYPDQAQARAALDLPPEKTWIALLPGSRRSEIQALGRIFLDTACWCQAQRSDLGFLLPVASPGLRPDLEALLSALPEALNLRLLDGRSRQALAAADLVLTASGTATLEALLSKKPMVVGYRVHPLSYALVKGLNLIQVPHIAMANLLAGEALAPEFLQQACRVDRLGPALLALLDDPPRRAHIQARYLSLHETLRADAGERAAAAVLHCAGVAGRGTPGKVDSGLV